MDGFLPNRQLSDCHWSAGRFQEVLSCGMSNVERRRLRDWWDQAKACMKILLVEDDRETGEYVSQGLREEGHVLSWATDGQQGVIEASGSEWDLLILDRMVPEIDGLGVVRLLRGVGVETPVLFLTALDGIDDRVTGLNAGADDYLAKPFAFAELVARVNALGRRPRRTLVETVLKIADLEIDLMTRTVSRAGHVIDLQPREFRLLEYLARHMGQVVTRTMLLENVWELRFDPHTNVVESHVSRLRAKLAVGGEKNLFIQFAGRAIVYVMLKVFRTSAFRLTLLYAGIFCASFIALFAIIYWSTARYMDRQLDDTVSNEIAEIESDVANGSVASLQNIVSGLTLNSPGFFYLLQDHDGNVLAGNLPAMAPIVGIIDRAHVEIQDRTLSLRGKGVSLNENAFLFVGLNTIELHKMQRAIARTFVWGLIATIFISLLSGAFISFAMLARVEALSNVSREIVNGDLDRRISLRGSNDEFDHLAVSLNTMFDRIQGLMDGLRQVSTDIAHDLRTPLTRLRQRIEMTLRKADDVASLRTAFQATLKDVN